MVDWDGETRVKTHSRVFSGGVDSDTDVMYRGKSRLDKELSANMGNRIADMHIDSHMKYLSTDAYKSLGHSGGGLGDLIQTSSSILSLAKFFL